MMINKKALVNHATAFKILLFVLVIFLKANGFAQEKDFGAWYSVAGKYEIVKNISLSVSEEFRTNSNASKTDQVFTDVGLSYKFNKYISLSAAYRFIMKREANDLFFARHRFYSEISLQYPIKRFEISYRFRFQRQENQYAEEAADLLPIFYNRHKIEVEYNIRDSKFAPSVFYEHFFRLNYISSYFADNIRYGAGLNYRFNKKHTANVGFLINQDLYPRPKYLYVVTVGYRYTFK